MVTRAGAPTSSPAAPRRDSAVIAALALLALAVALADVALVLQRHDRPAAPRGDVRTALTALAQARTARLHVTTKVTLYDDGGTTTAVTGARGPYDLTTRSGRLDYAAGAMGAPAAVPGELLLVRGETFVRFRTPTATTALGSLTLLGGSDVWYRQPAPELIGGGLVGTGTAAVSVSAVSTSDGDGGHGVADPYALLSALVRAPGELTTVPARASVTRGQRLRAFALAPGSAPAVAAGAPDAEVALWLDDAGALRRVTVDGRVPDARAGSLAPAGVSIAVEIEQAGVVVPAVAAPEPQETLDLTRLRGIEGQSRLSRCTAASARAAIEAARVLPAPVPTPDPAVARRSFLRCLAS